MQNKRRLTKPQTSRQATQFAGALAVAASCLGPWFPIHAQTPERQLQVSRATSTSQCSSVPLQGQAEEAIHWISSGIWIRGSEQGTAPRFLFVDPYQKAIFSVTTDGLLSIVPDPRTSAAAAGELRPTVLVSSGENIVLGRAQGQPAVILNQRMEELRDFVQRRDPNQLNDAVANNGATAPGALYSGWIISKQRFLYAYGTVLTPGELPQEAKQDGFALGFLRARFDEAVGESFGVELLHQLPVRPEGSNPEGFEFLRANSYYVLGVNPIAEVEVGGEPFVYFLALLSDTGSVRLLRAADAQGAKVEDVSHLLPSEFRTATKLETKVVGFSDKTTVALYDELQKATAPVGIYSLGQDHLALLARKPGKKKSGETEWLLFTLIAPGRESGRAQNPAVLPSLAPHLTLVPMQEEQAWGLIDRGRVVATGRQTIGPLRIVSNQAVEGAQATAVPVPCS